MDKIPNPLASLLTANRERYNAKFAAARHYHPRLDGAIFAGLLRTTLAPVVEAVHAVAPDQAAAAAEALYDIALDLLAQDLLGPDARHPVISSGWTHLLPRLARPLASEPRSVAASITNALYNLACTPGARPDQWTADIIALNDVCEEAPVLLRAGQVCAWRAGMAHYRDGALHLARELPPRIARLCLGLPVDSTQPLDSVIDRLQADPWWRPASNLQPPTLEDPRREAKRANPRLQIVARVGAFRGFGGLFIAPPVVFFANDQFIVTDGEGSWLLAADAFGATFHRAEAGPPEVKISSPFTLDRSGEVTAPDDKRLFPELARSTSTAANRTTLAATVPYSHAVYLVAIA